MNPNEVLADDTTLARLEAVRMHPYNARALAIFEVAQDASAKREVGAELLDAGFRYVGAAAERAKGTKGDLCDAFVDADQTTYVVVRRTRTLLPLSRYYIVTVFDDVSCIETVSQARPVVPSEPRLTMRGGHDDVVRDAREHRDAVRAYAAKGPKVIPVRTLDDIARIKRFYISHVISPEQASNIADIRTMRLKLWTFGLVTVLFVAYQIWRAVRR